LLPTENDQGVRQLEFAILIIASSSHIPVTTAGLQLVG
jgi:hypothetical protein